MLFCGGRDVCNFANGPLNPERQADAFASDLILPNYLLGPRLRRIKRPTLAPRPTGRALVGREPPPSAFGPNSGKRSAIGGEPHRSGFPADRSPDHPGDQETAPARRPFALGSTCARAPLLRRSSISKSILSVESATYMDSWSGRMEPTIASGSSHSSQTTGRPAEAENNSSENTSSPIGRRK